MKIALSILRNAILISLIGGTLAYAATLTGTVTNKTTGKPAAGDAVALVDVQAGMNEVAGATTDARGHYSLSKTGSSNYLVRVTHQGAPYFIGAPEGGASGDISVYDVAAKVDGVVIDEDVVGIVETANSQLHVIERYSIHNASQPPRTQWSQHTFEIVLPDEAVVEGVSAQRPGRMLTSVKLDPAGPKGHYSFNFPIQPDDGEKGTLFQLEYKLPYNGKYTFHPQESIPARTLWVMMPKSMTFAAGAGSEFLSSVQDPSFLTFVAKNLAPGKPLEFTVSGNGTLPREDQDSQGGQGAPAAQPGGGMANPIGTPDPIPNKYKWWILTVVVLVMVIAAAFLLRKTPPSASFVSAAAPPIPAPAAGNTALLHVLKEELFALESEKISGTLAPAEYDEQKVALETVLRRALKRQGNKA
jgi:hypothetical protein